VPEALPRTPHDDGFAMPAEWEPHAGTWMIWPERTDNWRLGAKPAQRSFTAVAEAIADFEPVTMLASVRQYHQARAVLSGRIRVVECSTNDSWCRDEGPTFVVDGTGGLRGVDWTFNAWGGLYSPFDLDDAVAGKILDIERVPRYRSPLTCEGGALHVDGAGTVISTTDVLLSPHRNPGWSRADVEKALRDYLGVDRVLWTPHGIPGDETGGHIDDLACFVAPEAIALSWCADVDDPHHAISRDAEQTYLDAGLTVERLPMPPPMYLTAEEASGIDRSPPGVFGAAGMSREPGERLAASYANFLIVNGGVIAPAFVAGATDAAADTDAEARATLQRLFPDRRVIMIPSREILLGGGNIHCITQQQPVGTGR
jgi:agmatine deiminase